MATRVSPRHTFKACPAHTFRLAAQQNVDPAKHLNGLRDGGATARHTPPITPNAANAISPPLAITAVALTLANQLSKLGAAVLVVDLVGRQACNDIVAVGQQKPDEAHGDGR